MENRAYWKLSYWAGIADPYPTWEKSFRECKRRHVKCDEQRPICIQCVTLKRECLYLDRSSHAHVPALESSSPQLPSKPVRAYPWNSSIFDFLQLPLDLGSARLSHQNYDLSNLALLHHFETNMMKPPHYHFVLDDSDGGPLLQLILLRFAALHLGVINADATEEQQYRQQAVQLQMRALALYNSLNPEVTAQNCTTVFLFFSLTGLHMLHDTVNTEPDKLELLEKFIQFMHFYHGLGTIINRGWHVIRNSELKIIFDPIVAMDRPGAKSGEECEGLMRLLLAAKERLGPELAQAVFDQYSALPEPINRQVILGWLLRTPAEYLNLLNMRQPEAFALLAHWAVILHWGRSFWVYGHAGRILLWDHWMAWPNQAIRHT
ncbi:hypothetical protein GGI43DRAFT_423175 [Trichoderma evansii]